MVLSHLSVLETAKKMVKPSLRGSFVLHAATQASPSTVAYVLPTSAWKPCTLTVRHRMQNLVLQVTEAAEEAEAGIWNQESSYCHAGCCLDHVTSSWLSCTDGNTVTTNKQVQCLQGYFTFDKQHTWIDNLQVTARVWKEKDAWNLELEVSNILSLNKVHKLTKEKGAGERNGASFYFLDMNGAPGHPYTTDVIYGACTKGKNMKDEWKWT
ncbi:hypothetical protein MUK42_22585 [Musa troglodytarum]|uniref:Uncharacterized protein n=1 Tax=Musa troglodytarum TaxID=320322 RepID=A0A9E7EP06_9LILI|nr:hypothetical protein MUK42_22585 [Musa troglodytarum]